MKFSLDMHTEVKTLESINIWCHPWHEQQDSQVGLTMNNYLKYSPLTGEMARKGINKKKKIFKKEETNVIYDVLNC